MGITDFFGIGYKPCNELADKVLNECLHGKASQSVPLPWARGRALTNTGKLNAIAAIAGNVFGVAKKGEGARAKYKCYYRRDMTGNWFAEIWGLWKTAFIAAPMFYIATELGPYLLRSIRTGNPYPGENLTLFLLGILMVLMFLPRALLAFGCQLQAASTAGYNGEFSGVIALPMGILGANLAIFGLFQEWDLGAFLDLFWKGLSFVFVHNNFRSIFSLCWMFLIYAGGLVVAAWFFWMVSLRSFALNNIVAVFGRNNFEPTTNFEELCRDTEHVRVLDGTRGDPRVALAAIIYVFGILGAANMPLITWAKTFF